MGAAEGWQDSGFVELNGAPIFYEVSGAGQPLALLHAGLADSRMYQAQFVAFAQHYRTVRYDFHGFGRSGNPDRYYSHHAVLRGLLEHLGIEQAALLGTSLGASVAIDFVLTYPSMVRALVLLAPGISGHPAPPAMMSQAAPLMQAFEAGDFFRVIDLTVRLWLDGPGRGPAEVDPAIREGVRSMYTDVLRRSREGSRRADELDPPAYARLQDIHVPTLVVVGSGDVPHVQEAADLLERGIDGAEKVVLPRVAHLFNLERAQETNEIVLDFLRRRVG